MRCQTHFQRARDHPVGADKEQQRQAGDSVFIEAAWTGLHRKRARQQPAAKQQQRKLYTHMAQHGRFQPRCAAQRYRQGNNACDEASPSRKLGGEDHLRRASYIATASAKAFDGISKSSIFTSRPSLSTMWNAALWTNSPNGAGSTTMPKVWSTALRCASALMPTIFQIAGSARCRNAYDARRSPVSRGSKLMLIKRTLSCKCRLRIVCCIC